MLITEPTVHLASILHHLHLTITRILLCGRWAHKLASILPPLRRIELIPFTHNSQFFHAQVALRYDPCVGL